MPYQYKREPLTQDEVNRLANACVQHVDKLIVWTLLDTGLRVSEFAGLTRDKVDWQTHRLMIYGKGGPSFREAGTATTEGNIWRYRTRHCRRAVGRSGRPLCGPMRPKRTQLRLSAS
jgi:integrase